MDSRNKPKGPEDQKTKITDVSAAFTEFRVVFDKSHDDYSKSLTSLPIVLKENIDPLALPYADIYTPEELKKVGVERFNNCMALMRGDDRSPEEIIAVGGFHPQFTNPQYASKKDVPKKGNEILDVTLHRLDAAGSGLVSFTSSLDIAKLFSGRESGYVYIVKATGAIGPVSFDCEEEYSVPGGIDAVDIVAFRKVDLRELNSESSIFVSNDFMKKYPHQIENIINAYLEKHEHCLGMQVPKEENLNLNDSASNGFSPNDVDAFIQSLIGEPDLNPALGKNLIDILLENQDEEENVDEKHLIDILLENENVDEMPVSDDKGIGVNPTMEDALSVDSSVDIDDEEGSAYDSDFGNFHYFRLFKDPQKKSDNGLNAGETGKETRPHEIKKG